MEPSHEPGPHPKARASSSAAPPAPRQRAAASASAAEPDRPSQPVRPAPAVLSSDDRTFVAAFQAIDRAIINPWFMASFLGVLVLTGLAAALHLGADDPSVLPWIVAAFVLDLVAVVITLAVNVPRNDAIKAAGDPDRIGDLKGVRERFNEARWAAWNVVRTLTSTAAFGCLAWALVVDGGRN